MNATAIKSSFTAVLPFPPSVSNLFLNVAHGGRVKTKNYRAWDKRADAVKPTDIVRLEGRCYAVYIYGRPDRRRRDPPNLEKAMGDTLTRRGALEDDSQIVDIRLRWAAPSEIKPGECRVELSEMVTASVDQP